MLLFSFHGVPKRYLLNGDPYHCLCQKTARLTAESLGLEKDRYMVTFQSLFGKEEWLRPYTIDTVEELAQKRVKKLHVICPGFSVDCLETIEEIDGENREAFEEAHHKNGTHGVFHYIPALNDRDDIISFYIDLIREELGNWAEVKTREVGNL